MAYFLLNYFEKKLEIQCKMERINSFQVVKENYDASKKNELLSAAKTKPMETHIDQRDEAIRFFQGLISCGFFSFLFWAVLFWLIT
jgi:hypothetical protein